MRKHAVGVFAHAEKIRLLLHLLHGAVAVGTTAVLIELQLRPIALARCAVKPLVRPLVNVALVIDALEDVLYKHIVALLRGADKIVIRDAKQPPEFLEARNNAVNVLNGGHALLCGRLLDLLPVLIRAGQKEHIIARKPLEACNRIRNGGAVSVADMEFGTRVVDGGRDVKGLLFAHPDSSFRYNFLI